MQAYTTLQKGHLHRHFCEDAILSLPLGNYGFIGAVSDGCSSGTDSHLASALTCKLIRKIVLNYPQDREMPVREQALQILHRFMQEMKQTKNQLALSSDEMLATLSLLIYSSVQNSACVVMLGDGALAINEEIKEIDHDNRPDYPVYHLEKQEHWQEYFEKQTFVIDAPSQVAIASDGVFSFQQVSHETTGIVPANYLLTDRFLHENAGMLNRKCNILNKMHGLQPADDLGIVRLILN